MNSKCNNCGEHQSKHCRECYGCPGNHWSQCSKEKKKGKGV